MEFHPLPLHSLKPILSGSLPVILLDTAQQSEEHCHSFVFQDPVREITAQDFGSVERALAEIDDYSRQYWCAGFISYEAAYALEPRFSRFRDAAPVGVPLVWFGVFGDPLVFDHCAGRWNRDFPGCDEPEPDRLQPESAITVAPSLDESVFSGKIGTIRHAIGRGELYQVNFTFDVAVRAPISPFDLYVRLRNNQRTPFCAYINNRYGTIASFSPELFFSIRGGMITARPMKGTAARGNTAQEDEERKSGLRQDVKNRSENLMIVDLLRNDLGRICQAGSVVADRLFEVETHPTVHQMTSTVSGKLRDRTALSSVFRNIFPCGSVTGAPKIRAMEMIHELESGFRGVYCGALGYTVPQGDAVFNVPIRTLQKRSDADSWRYRVGSGIVWDSSAEAEWKECADKCAFLSLVQPEFELLESILYRGTFVYGREHATRLEKSSAYFNYPFTEKRLREIMDGISSELDCAASYKVRILLAANGRFRWDSARIVAPGTEPLKAVFASQPVNELSPLLYHKTTWRPWYECATPGIARGDYFDMIFYNSENQITEGARSNIFIERGGTLHTPPVSCGLLPGIVRGVLIGEGRCRETILLREDLLSADAVYCGNSVRGLVKVTVEG